jgi:hypothetical protein
MAVKKLAKLETEELDYFCRQVAEGIPLQQAISNFRRLFPDAHNYSQLSFLRFTKSDDGKAAIRAVKGKIREDAEALPFTDEATRTVALVKQAQTLMRIWQGPRKRKSEAAQEKEDAQYARLIRGMGGSYRTVALKEFRLILSEIREEAERMGLSVRRTASTFELMAQFMSDASKIVDPESKERQLIDEIMAPANLEEKNPWTLDSEKPTALEEVH